MMGIGAGELVLIMFVAFIIVGPEDLPKVAGKIGKALKRFRTVLQELKDDIDID